MMKYTITLDELIKNAPLMRAGDRILLTGTLYTARDAAHKRLFKLLKENKPLPFNLTGSAVYYAGPTATPPGRVIGSCGPTTSERMDVFAPKLYDLGMKVTIGKGGRGADVCDAIVRNRALYLCATGGAGALLAGCVKSCEVIAFPELGCESIKKLFVENMPLIVGADCIGGNMFHL